VQQMLIVQLVVAALCAVPYSLVRGQEVIKPRTSPPPRNPAPDKITASQLSDGRILVVWSAVPDADRYALYRSAPNVGNGPLTLPNPKDTVYTDSDVQKGNTYYYLVNAVNLAGVPGLKRGTAPVVATISAGQAPDTVPPRAATPVVIKPPVKVTARSFPYDAATIDVDPGPTRPDRTQGMRYLFERATRENGTQSPWEAYPSPNTPCCRLIWGQEKFPNGTRVIYRVTAYDSASPPNRSDPAFANEITSIKIAVARTDLLVANVRLRMTWDLSRHPDFVDAKLTGTTWGSLNEVVASVDRQGVVTPHSLGFAYVVGTGVTPAGAVQSFIWHVTVTE
jgi:hypothetical protein